ncbi:redoxin domain-containing protein [Pseudobacteriovorax antillogorgiicola]|uniref:Peroxiredoxin n=1 Tax=Pseudobacteriovorax antillogorgiicola TaxID=1513793 RepID=A0A1Y6C572_9BACT|nr:redoxin domain-containing protein [Pseudobacteriovorax antillogorgiicola]TCS49454.1 peroxiredoxin [Pseudobacteriovorax antillogorgiicola]SMF46405.1 Peroxiredoxin [Pseudobacteriovorax antillogorgiicola]
MKRFISVVTALLLSQSILAHRAEASAVVGKPAPTFSLPGHDGKMYSLEKFKGKHVVLEWFNNDCPYVDKHYHEKYRNMQTLQKNWTGKKDVVWLAIISSAPGKQGYLTAAQATKIKEEARKAHMTAILLDPKGTVGRMYNAKTTPHMFIIDPQGILRYDGAIDNKTSPRLAALKADGLQNYVSDGLGNLMASKSVNPSKTEPYGCSVKY